MQKPNRVTHEQNQWKHLEKSGKQQTYMEKWQAATANACREVASFEGEMLSQAGCGELTNLRKMLTSSVSNR